MGSFGPVTGPNMLKFPAHHPADLVGDAFAEPERAIRTSVMSLDGHWMDRKEGHDRSSGSSLTMELLFESVNQISPSAVAAIPWESSYTAGRPAVGSKSGEHTAGRYPADAFGKPDSSVNHSAPSAPERYPPAMKVAAERQTP